MSALTQQTYKECIFFFHVCFVKHYNSPSFFSSSHIINELIETERVYVEELQSIIEVRNSSVNSSGA